MKKLAAIIALLLVGLVAGAQTNVLYGNAGDYGLNAQRLSVTMTLVSPNPRAYGTILVRQDPIATKSDASGFFAFTNILWGNYTVVLSGAGGTAFPITIYTNTIGVVPIASLFPSGVPAPNPATNYYTRNQVDALVSSLSGVGQLLAGANITLSPANGLGPQVTIASTGGGGGGGTGNVTGPNASTIGELPTYDQTSGQHLGRSGIQSTNVAFQTSLNVVSNALASRVTGTTWNSLNGELPMLSGSAFNVAGSGYTTNSFPLRSQALGLIQGGTNMGAVITSSLNNGLMSMKIDGVSPNQLSNMLFAVVPALGDYPLMQADNLKGVDDANEALLNLSGVGFDQDLTSSATNFAMVDINGRAIKGGIGANLSWDPVLQVLNATGGAFALGPWRQGTNAQNNSLFWTNIVTGSVLTLLTNGNLVASNFIGRASSATAAVTATNLENVGSTGPGGNTARISTAGNNGFNITDADGSALGITGASLTYAWSPVSAIDPLTLRDTNGVTFAKLTLTGGWIGNGQGLTNMNADGLWFGLIRDARLDLNVARTNNVNGPLRTNAFGLVDCFTNGVPLWSVPTGSHCWTTSGQEYSRTNGAWVAINITGTGTGGTGTFNGPGSSVAHNFVSFADGGGATGEDSGKGAGSFVATNQLDSSRSNFVARFNFIDTTKSNVLYSTIAGGFGNFMSAKTDNSGNGGPFAVGTYGCFIGGGATNSIFALFGSELDAILSRPADEISSNSFIGAGDHNTVSGSANFIGAGSHNVIQEDADGATDYAVIGGGQGNSITASPWSVIGGGRNNGIDWVGAYDVIGGGSNNNTQGNGEYYDFIGGGVNNLMNGASYSAIPGGSNNVVRGNFSFGFGRNVSTTHAGVTAFSDSLATGASDTTSNQFVGQFASGYLFGGGPSTLTVPGGWPASTNAPVSMTNMVEWFFENSLGVGSIAAPGVTNLLAIDPGSNVTQVLIGPGVALVPTGTHVATLVGAQDVYTNFLNTTNIVLPSDGIKRVGIITNAGPDIFISFAGPNVGSFSFIVTTNTLHLAPHVPLLGYSNIVVTNVLLDVQFYGGTNRSVGAENELPL